MIFICAWIRPSRLVAPVAANCKCMAKHVFDKAVSTTSGAPNNNAYNWTANC